MGRSRYKICELDKPYFMTCTISGWLPVFTRPETVNIVLDSWRYLQQSSGFKLYGYVVLENHLHFIAESKQLSKDVQRFKSYTARKIIDYLMQQKKDLLLDALKYYKKQHKQESDYQFWQEGSHNQCIESDNMMRQKLEYIHHNPVKRGYVDSAEHWRYSSARNCFGGAGLIEVSKVY